MSHPKRIFFDVYRVIIAVLIEILYIKPKGHNDRRTNCNDQPHKSQRWIPWPWCLQLIVRTYKIIDIFTFFSYSPTCAPKVYVILSNRFFQLMQNVYKELRDTVELSNFRQYVNSEIIENENGPWFLGFFFILRQCFK